MRYDPVCLGMEIRMPIMIGQLMAMLGAENDISKKYIRSQGITQWSLPEIE
jgi:hypothetical protein